MTVTHRVHIQRAAAEAATRVTGVAGLQPALADRLARAAARPHQAGAAPHREGAGIRCEHTADGGWHVEVRCILRTDRRVVEVAKQVCIEVRHAVANYLAQHCAADHVTVQVTVTRTV
ncbi:Asp23/Gls24 family envelope stress response protein [Streptomyces vinaceus]|uniref:Asp23/Gls24 family envelope stress response protein n=1 Tax=Streptomyces vinaceus TaxID=1960 RepID=UPI0036A5E149